MANKVIPNHIQDSKMAWLIACGAFGVFVFNSGVFRGLGPIIPEIVHYYGASYGTVSWIGGLMSFGFSSCGPLASTLTDIFGAKLVLMGAGVILTCSLVLASMTTNIYVVVILIGLGGGIGLGLALSPATIVTSQHFDKRRSLAMTFAYAGPSISGVLLPLILGYCIDYYSIRGVFFLLGAWGCQSIVFAALFWDFSVSSEQFEVPKDSLGKLQRRMTVESFASCMTDISEAPSCSTIADAHEVIPIPTDFDEKKDAPPPYFTTASRSVSVSSLPEIKGKMRGSVMVNTRRLSSTNSLPKIDDPVYKVRMTAYRKPSQISLGSAIDLQDASDDCNAHPYWWECSCMGQLLCQCSRKDQRKAHFDIALFRNLSFLSHSITMMLSMITMTGAFTLFVSCIEEKGITPHTAELMASVFSLANIVAKPLFGFFADANVISPFFIHAGINIGQGVLTGCLIFCESELSFWVTSMFMGVFLTMTLPFDPTLLREILGPQKLNTGYGLANFLVGTTGLYAMYIIGMLRDVTGGWDTSLLLLAGCSVLAGVLTIVEALVSRRIKFRGT